MPYSLSFVLFFVPDREHTSYGSTSTSRTIALPARINVKQNYHLYYTSWFCARRTYKRSTIFPHACNVMYMVKCVYLTFFLDLTNSKREMVFFRIYYKHVCSIAQLKHIYVLHIADRI